MKKLKQTNFSINFIPESFNAIIKEIARLPSLFAVNFPKKNAPNIFKFIKTTFPTKYLQIQIAQKLARYPILKQ